MLVKNSRYLFTYLDIALSGGGGGELVEETTVTFVYSVT